MTENNKKHKVNFVNLLKGIIRPGYCASCGACLSVCPLDSIRIVDNFPKLVSRCTSCGSCVEACYRYEFRQKGYPELPTFFNGFKEVYVGKTKLDHVKKVAQNGGIVTSLLINALNEKMIDGALVTKQGETLLEHIPLLATSEEEILGAAKSKYVLAHSARKFDMIKADEKQNVAVVGVPCQISGLTNMQKKKYLGLHKRVKYKISLFCMHAYDHDAILNFMQDTLNIKAEDLVKMDIDKGKFIFQTKNEVKKVKLRDLDFASAPGCHYCRDFVGEDADISIGNVGVDAVTNVIIVRTEKGKELLYSAIEHDIIDVEKVEQERWPEVLAIAYKLDKKKKKSPTLPSLD